MGDSHVARSIHNMPGSGSKINYMILWINSQRYNGYGKHGTFPHQNEGAVGGICEKDNAPHLYSPASYNQRLWPCWISSRTNQHPGLTRKPGLCPHPSCPSAPWPPLRWRVSHAECAHSPPPCRIREGSPGSCKLRREWPGPVGRQQSGSPARLVRGEDPAAQQHVRVHPLQAPSDLHVHNALLWWPVFVPLQRCLADAQDNPQRGLVQTPPEGCVDTLVHLAQWGGTVMLQLPKQDIVVLHGHDHDGGDLVNEHAPLAGPDVLGSHLHFRPFHYLQDIGQVRMVQEDIGF